MKRFFLIVLILGGLSNLFSQGIHRLETVVFDIVGSRSGTTRESALRGQMDLKEGDDFPDRGALEQAILRQKQDLINLRVFDTVDLSLLESGQEGDIWSYTLVVRVVDSWTLYAIPYPKYSSNEGFRLGLKTYYDNAFGSLNDLYLGMNITARKLLGEWRVTGWSVNPKLSNIRIGSNDFSFSFLQEYAYSERMDADGKTYLESYNYYESSLEVSTSFRFGAEKKFYYFIKPKVGLRYFYSGIGYEGKEEPLHLSLLSKFGYEKVDWVDNFRVGLGGNIYGSVRYIDSAEIIAEEVQGGRSTIRGSLGGSFMYHKILHPRLNFHTRVSTDFALNDELNGLGRFVRGVADSTMYGVWGGYYNLDLTIAVLRWEDFWFIGGGEAQFQPFFDLGLVKRDNYRIDWDNDLRYGVGADFILYLNKLSSLEARATFGIDLSSHNSFTDLRKYELEISSSLSY